MVPATATRLTLATIATRRPAVMTGTAIGSSTRKNRPSGRKPMAVAACTVSVGDRAQAVGDHPDEQGDGVERSARSGPARGQRVSKPNSGGMITNSAIEGIV